MPINIEMPKLSDTMTEGTVVRWLKKEGEEVEIGDIIAEIETDKATMEMEAFDEGVLSKISVPEGGKAPVGSAIAVLLEDGESDVQDPPSAESSTAASANTPPRRFSKHPPPPRPKLWNQPPPQSISHKPLPQLQPTANASRPLRLLRRSPSPKASTFPLCREPVQEVAS